jgi:hypothetical protein
MAQYKIGTVAITNGSAVIVGSGTLWSNVINNIKAGDIFVPFGSVTSYVVQTVTDDTHITLTGNITDATASGISYVLTRDFTALTQLPLLGTGDTQTGKLFNQAMSRIDTLLSSPVAVNLSVSGVASFAAGTVGAPSITHTGDLDTGIYFPAAINSLGLVSAGSEKLRVNTTGIGINTTAPGSPLEVMSSADTNTSALRISRNGTSGQYISIGTYGDGLIQYTAASKDLVINNNSTTAGDIILQTLGNEGYRLSRSGDSSWKNSDGDVGMTWDASGNSGAGSLGIGTSTPIGFLHIKNGSAGAVSTNGNADDIIIEGNPGSGNGIGMSFLTPDLSYTRFLFGTPSDSIGGKLEYNYNAGNPYMALSTLNPNGSVQIGGGGGTAVITVKSTGVVNIVGLPTSSAGLVSGDLWRNGLVVNVIA